MKQWTKLGGRLLALALVLCIGASLLPVAPVLAQEDSGTQSAMDVSAADPAESAGETEQAVPSAEQAVAGEANTDDTTGGVTSADEAVFEDNGTEGGESAAEVSMEPEGSSEENDTPDADSSLEPTRTEDSTDEEDSLAEPESNGIEALDDVAGETLAPADADAFQLEVSFAGQTLQEKTTNAISDGWDVTTAQSLQVSLKRDTTLEIDETKQYVLCLKASEGFYFTTLPEIDKIEGAEEIAFVQNTSASGTELEPYSGEIRIRVNPAAETVNLGVLGVKVSDTLAAAAGTGLTVQNPVKVQLVTADGSLNLKDMLDSDKTKLHGYIVDSAQLVDTNASSSISAMDEGTAPDGIEAIDDETTTGGEETIEPRVVDEKGAFSVSVKLSGADLTENGPNNITSAWDGSAVPTMEVTVTRNRGVDVDPQKQYVLCLKTSDIFYFNGVPDVSTITGADEAVMISNEAPIVKRLVGATVREGKLENFSTYSGEIRIKINPSTDVVTITDIGISYNPALVGYTKGTQTINDPINIQLVSADGSESLGGIEEKDMQLLHQFPINSVGITTDAAGGGLRVFNSMDNFDTNRLGTAAKLSKEDTICYALGSQKQTEMVYKNLSFVLHIPYVEVNGEKHYLSFDADDSAIKENKKGSKYGYPLSNAVTYNESEHTLTYDFENIYMSSWNNAVYTPTFRWPDELKNMEILQNYIVTGFYWDVTAKTCYTGAESSFASRWPNLNQSTNTETVFTAIAPEIVLGTDVQPAATTKGLGIPMIYKDVNLSTGYYGFLGFFDIHNEGAGDSPKVKIDITFNDGKGSGANYYVTRMVLPSDMSPVTVEFTLQSRITGDKKTDKRTYTNSSSFSCDVAVLRSQTGVGNEYFIKKLTYETTLRKSKWYHSEVMHSGRNTIGTSGAFQGYMSGNVGQKASATMTITSADGSSPLNSNNDISLTATEESTVSDLDFIANGFGTATLDGQSSTNITAGSDATLSFSLSTTGEEYPLAAKSGGEINGYHVMRDGVFYVCLPEGVSILGEDQVQLNVGYGTGKRNIPVKNVTILKNTKCNVNGTTAYWWKFEADGMNINGYAAANGLNTAYVTIKLSTDIGMAGVNWSFNNCIAVATNGQKLSRTTDSFTSAANTTAELKKLNLPSATALAGCYSDDDDSLGLNLYRANVSVNLNIARAEAKLDVTTALLTSESTAKNDTVVLSDVNAKVTYAVTVTGTEGGAARNFNYYIPVVHTTSTLDAGALVGRNEIGLKLIEAVNIIPVGTDTEDAADATFEVYYTTENNLNSTTIRGENVKWYTSVDDYSQVTAVRIATVDEATIKTKETYQFNVVMQYDNTALDFEKQAGSIAQWRSFGHYTYHSESGALTTNAYPSDDNSVRIRYVSDLTSSPMTLTLDTSAASNKIDTSQLLPTTFVKNQTLVIKKVTPTSGTTLMTGDPSKLTGAEANGNFHMSFHLNNMAAATLPSIGEQWTVEAGSKINLQAEVQFSTALTDVNTERYVDIVLGNDDIDITCRVVLARKVAAASAKDSGVAVGENFVVPKVGANCKISKDSSFTALYVVENFIPGNFSSQVLKWQDGSGSEASFPSGTTITMMEISDTNTVTSYWYCRPNGSKVNLNEFTRMAGTDKYRYDTTATAPTTLRYMFVVNFGQAAANVGSYKLVFDADAKTGVAAFTPVGLGVGLGMTKTYGLTASSTATVQQPSVTVDYTMNAANGNDSYSEGRSLSLVLSAKDHGALPQDAQIKVENTLYSCNGKNVIIIPIGTIASGRKELTLTSQMFPEEATSYSFDAVLYLSKSRQDAAPTNGDRVASCEITFTKSAEKRPALCVTGTRVAERSDWVSGQEINISMENMEDCTVTVTAYSGLSSTQKVTDLMSSVSGIFNIESGTGTYNASAAPTGKLVLSSAAKAGTYRLSFDVKKDGKTVMTVPYYIIVR